MTAHTKGPWYFELLQDYNILSITTRTRDNIEEGDETDYSIAGIAAPGSKDYANAHLISAAPEMLDALESLLIEYERTIASIGGEYIRPDFTKDVAYIKAKCAISKAKGEL